MRFLRVKIRISVFLRVEIRVSIYTRDNYQHESKSKCFFDIFSFDSKTDISHFFEMKIKRNV